MKSLFLVTGSGGSMGIPVVGCTCEVCRSSNPYNHRLRSGAVVIHQGKKILIDVGPDFRAQGLANQWHHLDGVIVTHCHYDHTAGIDDLRALFFRRKEPMPFLLSRETYADLKTRFNYIFEPKGDTLTLLPEFDVRFLEGDHGTGELEGVSFRYLTYYQAGMKVNGFIFGDLAYITDIKEYDKSLIDALKGVRTLVISALRFTPSPIHFTVDEAIDFAEKVGAEKTWLTHISHEIDHEKTNAYLPPHVRMGYDGLEISFYG